MKTYYLHTIDGRPAFFSRDTQEIYYANFYGPAIPLEHSLKDIKKQQALSRRNRAEAGFLTDGIVGYRRVRIPE